MADYPRTLAEFEKRFATEESCRAYLAGMRWPEGFRCAACGGTEAWTTQRGLWVCRRCQRHTSLTAGTVFQGTRTDLQTWLRAMWWVTNQKNGISALGLQRALGLGSYETAWTWMHKLRRAMVRPGRERLRGRVEVDETYVGGHRPGKHGRGASGKTLVLVAAEEDGPRIGRIRLERAPNGSAATMEAFLGRSIEPGAVVISDGNPAYGAVRALGYRHQVSLMKKAEGDQDKMLPRVHRVASLLKRWLLGTHQGAVRPHQLDYYLDEFTFRFNRRTSRSRGLLFHRLLEQALHVEPTRYSLIAGPRRPD
jgi:transposase-like protein